MLKEMIVTIGFLTTFLATPLAMASDSAQKIPSNSMMASIPEKTSMLDMSDDETQKLIQDAADFVGKNFYISNSFCLNSDLINTQTERLSDALYYEMQQVSGKWSHVVHGVFVEGGTILGQAMCTGFVVRNARHRVLAVGGISVGVLGINDGNPLDATDPNEVAIFYRSRADLQTALPQINGFARFYIKSFIDPSSPETNPPPTYIETQYDLGRCGAGKSGKHIDVKTCPKQVKTLPVK